MEDVTPDAEVFDFRSPEGEVSETPVGAPDRGAAESFGTWLRQQRELREIDLREIADRTKISVRYLRAMEQDRFDLLPGPIFAKGFLREYARYVGLDPDEAVNFYLSTQLEQEEVEQAEAAAAAPRGGGWGRGLAIALTVIVLLALLSFVLFSYLERRRDRSLEPSPPYGPPVQPAVTDRRGAAEPPSPGGAAAAAPSRSEEVPPADAAPLAVTVDFSQDCWVEVVVDGRERLDQRYVQGESLQLQARESVEFKTLGNAGGISIQVNGVPFAFDAREGQVLHDLLIDLETARRLAPEEE